MGGAGGMGIGGDEQAQTVRSLIRSTTFLDIC